MNAYTSFNRMSALSVLAIAIHASGFLSLPSVFSSSASNSILVSEEEAANVRGAQYVQSCYGSNLCVCGYTAAELVAGGVTEPIVYCSYNCQVVTGQVRAVKCDATNNQGTCAYYPTYYCNTTNCGNLIKGFCIAHNWSASGPTGVTCGTAVACP